MALGFAASPHSNYLYIVGHKLCGMMELVDMPGHTARCRGFDPHTWCDCTMKGLACRFESCCPCLLANGVQTNLFRLLSSEKVIAQR